MSKDAFEQWQNEDISKIEYASYEDMNRLEWLLRNSAISENLEREIYQRLNTNSYTKDQCEKEIEYLEQNQIDPISAGNTYQAKDIKNKLKQLK